MPPNSTEEAILDNVRIDCIYFSPCIKATPAARLTDMGTTLPDSSDLEKAKKYPNSRAQLHSQDA